MLNKLCRWLRERPILLALLTGAMLLIDAWRAPQLPAFFNSTPLQVLDGESVTLTTLNRNEPVLLYFWASWYDIYRFTTSEVARLRSEGEDVMTIALRFGNEAKVSR